MLSIHLFGTPELLRDDVPIPITRRKSRAVLFYLAAQAGPVSRAHLQALFWPDHETRAAQQLLRTTLHGLRRDLGDALLASDTSLELAGDVPIDARLLALALQQGDEPGLTAALDGYRGEFLSAFSVPDNPEFDDWVVAERERYHRMALRGWELLAQRRAERGDYAAALDAVGSALAADPLSEGLQRTAMRLHYRMGNRAAAIRQYEYLRERLDNELGVPPLAETQQLYDAIVTDSLPDERPAALQPAAAGLPPVRPVISRPAVPARQETALPFVGREHELAVLASLLNGARFVLIEGEPGIGKTQLAEEFMLRSGALALHGAARELEQTLPYHPIRDAMRVLVNREDWPAVREQLAVAPVWMCELTRLLPEIAPDNLPSTAAGDETRLWEAISQLLQALARQHPAILFIDDLQWADAATNGLLAYLARRSADVPLTLLATARQVAPRTALATLLQTLTREDRLARIALARLEAEDIRKLAQAVSPHFPEPLAAWLARNAEGNPYITVELVRYARERKLLGPNGTLVPGAANGEPHVPHTVQSLIESRLERLSEPARRLLDLAVAVGREFGFEVVARASGLPEASVFDTLDELRASGLIHAVGDQQYAFDHSLTVEVANRSVDEARHRRLHRRIAETIAALSAERLDDVAGVVAWHFAEGHDLQRAAPYALRAARRAVHLGAWQEAIRFYLQALGGDPERRQAISMELGAAYEHVGEAAAAADAYQEAAALARAHGDRAAADAARLAIGQTLLAQARFGDAIAITRNVREHGHPGSAARAELQWGLILSVEGADLAGAAEHLVRAEGLIDANADPATMAFIAFERGSVRAQQGDLDEALALYRRALELAERDPFAVRQRILIYNNLAYHMVLRGDPQAEAHARHGMQLAQESGVLGLQPYLHSTLGEIALAGGDLATAEREFSHGLALAERLHVPERIAGLTANLGLVAIQRGQETLAVHRLSSAQAQADALGTPHLAAQIRIWLAPLLPPAEARATLAAARALAEQGSRRRLLAEIERLEQSVVAAVSSQ